jgi:CRISPR-associated endonuclease/helicase Cas3
MRWQSRLFDRLRSGNELPRICDLPTGLGKTSVIPIWLIALAAHRQEGSAPLPRRLVYIVNRRTVVDQATSVVTDIRKRLLEPDDPRWSKHGEILQSLAAALRVTTSPKGLPVAVSTLRGELADNEEWKVDPRRPAIIIGTIDMIGSRLLFSGYGDGRYHRAHHVGLIGQDVLIVHDEAHLTPALSELLRSVAEVQHRSGDPRPPRVMELSATQRDGYDDGQILRLEPEDENDAIVGDRLDATKHLRLHPADDGQVNAKLADLARSHEADGRSATKVLVYVRSPNDAQKIADQLKKQLGGDADNRVTLLTGTIRGFERDELVEHQAIKCLRGDVCPLRTFYLVATSAGEVGIDLDADHMVCDMTTLDSMIQRLGRVNRRGGENRTADIDAVWLPEDASPKGTPSSLNRAIAATIAILRQWAGEPNKIDASPRHVRLLLDALGDDERQAAFSPKPDALPLTEILLDAWSLTSVQDMPGRPEVAAYLHGLTNDPPETYVVWRKEVAELEAAAPSENLPADAFTSMNRDFEMVLSDWYRACRITARERLRDRTDRVATTLADLLKAHRRNDSRRDFPVVLLDERGSASWCRLSEAVAKNFNLAYRTLVLPVELGGLNVHGMLDAKVLEPIANIDVAEAGERENCRERWLHVFRSEGDERCLRLLTGDSSPTLPPELLEQERIALKDDLEDGETKGETADLVLMVSRRRSLETPERVKEEQTLERHTKVITEQITRIAAGLGLPEPIRGALVLAARWHDRGKERPVWQRFACNGAGTEPLAKSTRYLHPRALGGYRHEFGSLLEAMNDQELKEHPEHDLVMHLIAAHHGWARPHFELRSFDHAYTTVDNTDAAAEVLRRFGRLQKRFGRWGLAWLESLLRCADIAASGDTAASAMAVQPPEAQA